MLRAVKLPGTIAGALPARRVKSTVTFLHSNAQKFMIVFLAYFWIVRTVHCALQNASGQLALVCGQLHAGGTSFAQVSRFGSHCSALRGPNGARNAPDDPRPVCRRAAGSHTLGADCVRLIVADWAGICVAGPTDRRLPCGWGSESNWSAARTPAGWPHAQTDTRAASYELGTSWGTLWSR